MPTGNVDTTRVGALFNDAAEAAASSLLENLAAGFVGEGTDPVEFVPGDSAVAVACRMHGLEGTMVLAMSAAMVAEVLNGPYGGQGVVAAVEPGLRAASVIFDQAAPRALRLDEFREVPPNEMFASGGEAWWFRATPLFRGEEHMASMAVFLLDPELLAAAEEAAEEAASAGYDLEDTASYSPPQAPPARGALPQFDPFSGPEVVASSHSLRLLHDVEMEVTVELGRTKMTVRSILGLTPGSVIELDRAAGAPVDLFVNGTLIGRGEVVVIDEEFGVRISEIVGRVDE